MGARGVGCLAGTLVVVLATGCAAAYLTTREGDGPEKVAADYFAAWRNGSFTGMERLVEDAPPDFADQHRALARGLSVSRVDLRPEPLVRDGKSGARVAYAVSRAVGGHGTWSFRSEVRLAKSGREWRVQWTPATLYPGLKGKATWDLRRIDVPAVTFAARDGRALPEDGTLEPYVTGLAERIGSDDEDGAPTSWAVELRDGGGPVQRLKLLGRGEGKPVRTTLDRRVQAAAEKAVAAAPGQAAIVALRPSTGEILAVADRLGGRGAFIGLYPPGSTFKTVTAAALVADGMSGGGSVECPASVVTAQRTIVNHDGESMGRATLLNAFAESCNTTFARLSVERLKAAKLAGGARSFGFGVPITPGVPAARGSFPEPENGAELAEASIGQGRVQASPLVMAVVAGSVADGTWRPPRLVDAKLIRKAGDPVAGTRPVPSASSLRAMMRAVVASGTASRAGLPPGTSGKTGTAETGEGQSHAWFIGYRGDLAFSVFVQQGGSGPKVAAPLAAQFLKSL
ncbi:penicillin-binding transpeptidase domain-containing protein [Spirillospora sp. CA-294931]|uniref:penicillin-binding transpeptidase domain-containing protein n=1 Tax=Spirillospora sp. CA-294931 TaxID=3240042 RepID=UPI003D91E808